MSLYDNVYAVVNSFKTDMAIACMTRNNQYDTVSCLIFSQLKLQMIQVVMCQPILND